MVPWKLVASLLLIGTALQSLINPAVTSSDLFGSEYIGIGAPLFPTEPGATATCYQYFFALAEANCTVYESGALPVRLHSCPSGNDASGVLVLERIRTGDGHAMLGPGAESGTAVYRLRMAGPDGLWLLEPTYCRPDFALAVYDLRHPGLYSLEVLMLYTSFSFTQPNASRAVQSPWAGYLTLDVRPVSSHTTTTTSASTSDAGATAAGAVHLARQRWTPSPDESILTNGDLTSLWNTDGDESSTTLQLSQQEQHHLRSRHPPRGGPDGSLPLCPDAGPLPGRWQFAEWPPMAAVTAAAAATLLRTCVWYTTVRPDADCGGPERRPLRHDSHPAALSWQPRGCRMRAFAGIPPPPPGGDGGGSGSPPAAPPPPEAAATPPITPSSCLPRGRRVCFVGDSHTRYLQNSLVLWQRGFRATVNNTGKELLASDSVHYEYMRWGHEWPGAAAAAGVGDDPLAAANCTDIVANFGQWPASYRSGPAPYSALQYLRELLRVRRALLLAARGAGGGGGGGGGGARRVRVFWVTTVMSSLKARLESAGVDWRTDPLLTLYNRLALDVMSGKLPALLARVRTAGSEGGMNVAAAAAGGGGARAEEDAGGASRQVEFGAGDGHPAETAAEQQQQEEESQRQRRQVAAQAKRHASIQGRAQAQAQGRREEPHRTADGRGSQDGSRSGDGSEDTEEVEEGGPRRPARGRGRRQPEPKWRSRWDGAGGATAAVTSPSPSPTELLLGWLRRAPPPWRRGRRRLLEQLLTDAEAEAASAGAEAEAIPVIDSWSATRILHDATWDGVHYANTGAVGLAQLTAVLHALCSDEAMAMAAAAAVMDASGAAAGAERR